MASRNKTNNGSGKILIPAATQELILCNNGQSVCLAARGGLNPDKKRCQHIISSYSL
jgi:hypothetical protein